MFFRSTGVLLCSASSLHRSTGTHTHTLCHAHTYVHTHPHTFILSVFPSIPGSAVCGFYLDDIERVFNGKFKEQKNSDSVWTSVPEEHVPTPRSVTHTMLTHVPLCCTCVNPHFTCVCMFSPGSCAGEGSASSFSSSAQFPDSVLSFIKTHPLMDESVPSVNNQPLITITASR